MALTLTTMKNRIADELSRDDLASQTANAISDAIKAYQDERFYFNETRANTFTTVANQEFYGKADAAFIGTILKIDYVFGYIGNQPFRLVAQKPAEMESASVNGTSTGQPQEYCFYNRQLRIYPVPDTAYVIRVGAAIIQPEPASDGETDNPWMDDAEMMIRARAKYEIALHVLKDLSLAQTMTAAVEEQFDSLKSKTNQMTQTENGRIAAMDF